MDFKLDAKMMSLLLLKECADWIKEHCSSGAAPAHADEGLVFRIEDEREAESFRARWLG